jgi:hypothetical protein
MRRNNLADMTVAEQLALIGETICDDLCRYREYAEQKRIQEDELKDFCSTCIVQRLYYSDGRPWKIEADQYLGEND